MGLPVEVNNLMMGSLGGYTIGRSLRFRSSASAYLSRTPASSGNRQKFTFSVWTKGMAGISGRDFGFLDATSGTYESTIRLDGGTLLQYVEYSGGLVHSAYISPSLRDPSAWYHLMIAIDTTQATQANRCKMYINGVLYTTTFAAGFAQNATLNLNQAIAHNIGRRGGSYNDRYFDGYIAEYMEASKYMIV